MLAMIDKHEPGKGKHTELFTTHIAAHIDLPSTEEELQHYVERKARREAERILSQEEAATHRQEHVRQTEARRHALNVRVIATFAK